KYKNFEKEGIRIEAVFDIDPSKYNAKMSVPVFAMDKLDSFIQDNKIRAAILCVPDIAAQQVFDQLHKAGIRGVLNFAPITLKAPEECIVSNVNLAVELENMIYFVNALEKASTSPDNPYKS
ncbi:MAG: redox-sensing transcriptional repressor Rex, partial [Fibrobacteres bacterium]|nr:redox-sensing transcriptional repressor Rex [Fibrobacterota bacterium]